MAMGKTISLCFMSVLTVTIIAMEGDLQKTKELCNFLIKESKKRVKDQDKNYIYLRVKSFLEYGALPNKNIQGLRPLHLAIKKDMPHQVITLLIKSGASVHFPGLQGETPLHAAVRNKNTYVVDILLKAGAWRNVEDYAGNLPLHDAIFYNASLEIITAVYAPFIINYQNNKGNTPLHIAMMEKDHRLIKKLLSWGADSEIKNHEGQIPLDLLGVSSRISELGLGACVIFASMNKLSSTE
jgi:hypothetical protein